jgi:hypothetical protein
VPTDEVLSADMSDVRRREELGDRIQISILDQRLIGLLDDLTFCSTDGNSPFHSCPRILHRLTTSPNTRI